MNDWPKELWREIERRGGLDFPKPSDRWTNHLVSQAVSAVEIQRKRIEAIYFKRLGISLHAAVFNSTRPSAFACITSKEGPGSSALVGVSYGFIYNSACMVSRMLGRSDMFLDVGIAEKELMPDALHYIPSSLADDEILAIQPKCPVRKAFTAFLMARFVDSVFMHEIAHLIRGHVRFVGKLGKLNWSDGENTVTGIDPLTKQALEFDADTYAIEECCNYSLLLREKLLGGELNSPDPAILDALFCLNGEQIKAAKYNFMSMYLPLRMFESNRWERRRQDLLTHPGPPIRMLYLMYNFSSNVLSDDIFGVNSEQSKLTVFEWAGECEENYMALQGEGIDARGIESAWKSPEASDYLANIHAELVRLAPILSKYVFKSSAD